MQVCLYVCLCVCICVCVCVCVREKEWGHSAWITAGDIQLDSATSWVKVCLCRALDLKVGLLAKLETVRNQIDGPLWVCNYTLHSQS